MSESEVKKAIKDFVTVRGGFWTSVVEGSVGAKIGDPDMVICYKGRFIAMEGKLYGGVQSDWQKLRMKQIRNAGGYYLLGRTVEEVSDLFDQIDKEDEENGTGVSLDRV